MRVLLDTHAFLWFIANDPKLGSAARQSISNAGNEVLVSAASVWEIAIKVNLGRLPIPTPLDQFVPDQLRINRMNLLPIELPHLYAVSGLPLYQHRDPFDRLLIAQAMVESIPLISRDEDFDAYPIQRLW